MGEGRGITWSAKVRDRVAKVKNSRAGRMAVGDAIGNWGL